MNKSRALSYALIVTIIFAGQVIPEYLVINESEYSYIKEDIPHDRKTEYIKAYEAGIYLSQTDNEVPIISHTLSTTRITAYSGNPTPFNTKVISNAEDFQYSQVDMMDFLTGDLDHLYEITDENLERSIRYDVFLLGQDWDSPVVQINVNRVYKGNDNYILGLYAPSPTDIIDDYGNWQESTFLGTAYHDNYKFYDNGFHTFYKLLYH